MVRSRKIVEAAVDSGVVGGGGVAGESDDSADSDYKPPAWNVGHAGVAKRLRDVSAEGSDSDCKPPARALCCVKLGSPAKLPVKSPDRLCALGSGGSLRKRWSGHLASQSHTRLRTFPGDLAWQIIVGMDCPCSDDPPPPRQMPNLAHGYTDAADPPSIDVSPNTAGMSRNVRKRLRHGQRNLACARGGVL